MTTTTPPKRARIFEPIGPVAERLGLTTGHLRELAIRSGIFTQQTPGLKGSRLLWTAEQERDLATWMVTSTDTRRPVPDDMDVF